MGILTLLRNAFGRGRKARTAEAEGAELPAPTSEPVAPASQPTGDAEASASIPQPAGTPETIPSLPEPAGDAEASPSVPEPTRDAEASPSVPEPTRDAEASPSDLEPTRDAEASPSVPEPTRDAEASPSVPEPRQADSDEHELVAAAFGNVQVPRQVEADQREAGPRETGPEESRSGEQTAAEAEVSPEKTGQKTGDGTPAAERPEAAQESEAPAGALQTPHAPAVTSPEPTAPESGAAPEPIAATATEPEAPAEPEVAAPEAAAEPKVIEPEPTEPDAEPEPDVTPEPRAAEEPVPTTAAVPAAPTEPTTVPQTAPAEHIPQGTPVPADESRTSGTGDTNTVAEEEAGTEEAGTETKPKSAVSLPKVRTRAPSLTTAYKAATAALRKTRLTGTRAKLYLVLDRSASMRAYYKDGSVQALADQALALAAHLDPQATVHVVFFSTDVDGTTDLALTPDHETKIDDVHAGLGRMGRTSYHAAVEAVLTHYEKNADPATPALVIFQTDGAPDAKTPATRSLTEAAGNHPSVFFSFVAFGEHDNKAFDYLRKLKSSNTSFFHAGPTPRELTDTELYDGLLASWRP
ncbi:hypothetical protein LK08_16270 [Streptomyces sp. MUSC 125]|uniref:VWA domain-containing protein n=1 Tax=Streptomyces sp. MUSC 125 TaxID=1428624 RepID=UPI00057C9D79|nr:VWA domain-containing protein [Streptomyces sp. MUSC 125]KIE25976.1 hypothetical protein LK08_16270 [Streptomyces sp. MUSC 125]